MILLAVMAGSADARTAPHRQGHATPAAARAEEDSGRALERGQAKLSDGQAEAAIADFDRAIHLRRHYAQAYRGRSAAFTALGQYQLALFDMDQLLLLEPDNAGDLQDRGRLHFRLAHYGQAADDLEKARALDPANADGVLWLHVIRAKLDREDALEFERNARKIDPNRWPAPVAAFILGRIDQKALAALARGDQARTCQADFYLGEDALADGREEDGVAYFRGAVKACHNDLLTRSDAQLELQRLGSRGL